MPYFDRFDICYAYQALENDWNRGGMLHERPSNQRRRESVGVQLARMQFRPAGDGGNFERLDENQKAIYVEALVRLGMNELLSWDDECHRGILQFAQEHYVPQWFVKHFPVPAAKE